MKKGTIYLINGEGMFARCIRWYNKRVYNIEGFTHAGIITEINKDDVLIYESLTNGFTKSYYDKKWVEEQVRKGKVVLLQSKKELKNIEENAEKYLGRGYAFTDLFNILIVLLFGRSSVNLSSGAKYLICSEAVARILYDASDKEINFETEFNKPYDQITPTDLYLSKQLERINYVK